MLLKDMFAKPVDRPIEGVIKANDDASLQLEMEEFVLTREIEKQLETFLESYQHYENANGVWISGFFGSGKSHLLKMLSLILENRDLGNDSALDMFLNKCEHNSFLKGQLHNIASIPSKSILFNIDQKAEITNKNDQDAILGVFVKVFNEMCGYYGKHGYVAQFERALDSKGLYEDFQKAYAEITGTPWQKGRELVLMEGRNVDAAYAKVTGDTSVINLISDYRRQYSVSIEDFAELVGTYAESHGENFRLNFFVDEVGQYIAENVKLMTNLQTLAESLNTRCRGRAWIIVTAQEDMSNIIGDMNRRQANDFSKIQARFAIRLKLTSQDVDEVIQRRLLQKNKAGEAELSRLYDREVNSFPTLLEFADGSVKYRNFRNKAHFTDCFPFIPYQFALFQEAIRGLSAHNAFSGRYSSVGERSMLVVFQDVAVSISNQPAGQLAACDRLYDGLRQALKTDIQNSILQAENHLDNAIAIRLLKILLLVKYVKGFNATLHNLCVLMLDRFDQDITRLQKDIEEALSILENQTYIQRNGEIYNYLTNEEKDIEEEIKNIDIETSKCQDEIQKIIFDTILKERKIRTENGLDYAFSRKLDDQCYGKETELAINVITPFGEYSGKDPRILAVQHADRCELLIVLPPDNRLMKELMLYKQTEIYVRQHASHVQDQTTDRIIAYKIGQNNERRIDVQERIRELLGRAQLFSMGRELEIEAGQAQLRLIKAFQTLIVLAYPQLKMLRDVVYTESNIRAYLQSAESGQKFATAQTVSEAEQEELNHLQNNSRAGMRTSGKNLVETFGRKPYGWPAAATLCILAKLYVSNKIEVRKNGVVLEGGQLEKALKSDLASILIEPQEEYTAAQLRRLKKFYEELFNEPVPGTDAKTLAVATSEKLREMVNSLEDLATRARKFPFEEQLQKPLDVLRPCLGKERGWYITEFVKLEEELLDMRDGIIEPIQKFMNGPKCQIFVQARDFLKEQESNLSYVDVELVNAMQKALASRTCYQGNSMQKLKMDLDKLKEVVEQKIKEIRTEAEQSIRSEWDRIVKGEEYGKISPDAQQKLQEGVETFLAGLNDIKLISALRDHARSFSEKESPQLIERIFALQPRKTVSPTPNQEKGYVDKNRLGEGKDQKITHESGETLPLEKKISTKQVVPEIKVIPITKISVSFDKVLLSTSQDVDVYLESWRTTLNDHISKGEKIKV